MGTNTTNLLLTDMPVFVRVVENGSFTAAARQMGMTPSALSRQVKRLEETLNTQLLERTTRNLRLTEVGAQIFERSQSILDVSNEILVLAELAHDVPKGTVRVSAPKALGKQVIHPLIPEFLERYPEVNIQLVISDQKLDVVADKLDLMIHITNKPVEGLVARALTSVSQVLVATPAYLESNGLPAHPKDLSDHSCLFLGETPFDSVWEFHSADEDHTVNVTGRYSVNHTEARLDAVLNNMGIACLPDFVVADALAAGQVQKILSQWELSGAYQGRVFVQYLYSKYLPPKTRAFINFLRGHLEPDVFRNQANTANTGSLISEN
ncbi:MAG: LysR family transcriptional regulator [Granulosicoccus sp.]